MPLPVPRLDDRTFADLVREGESLIPRYGRDWTDRNPSDPGVTLVELFAWLTETSLYQLDAVRDESIEGFLRLVGECRLGEPGLREPVDAALGRAVRGVHVRGRAVTAAEFEALAIEAGEGCTPGIARARYLRLGDPPPSSDPMIAGGCPDAPIAAAVVIVPDLPEEERPFPSTGLVRRVFDHLSERRVLATRIRVLGPAYVRVSIRARVARRRGSGLIAEGVREALLDFLHPLRGGPDGTGWPFGRWVYRSEIFQLLELLPGVDHVEDLVLLDDAGVERHTGVELPPVGLVHLPRPAVQVAVEEA